MDLEQLRSYLEPVSLTIFVFGLLVWLYTFGIQITQPAWLSAPLAHYGIPSFNCRVDDIAILSFAVAAFGFFVWRLERISDNGSPPTLGACPVTAKARQ